MTPISGFQWLSVALFSLPPANCQNQFRQTTHHVLTHDIPRVAVRSDPLKATGSHFQTPTIPHDLDILTLHAGEEARSHV